MTAHSRRTAVLAVWLVLLFRLVVESESFSSATLKLFHQKNRGEYCSRGGRAVATAAAERKSSHIDENDSQSFPIRSKKFLEAFSASYEKMLTRQRSRKERKETLRFISINALLYLGLYRSMLLFGVKKFVVGSNIAIFLTWLLAVHCSNFGLLLVMSKIFLTRTDSPWKHLKRQPFSLFGGAFSHLSLGHILFNGCAFLQLCGTVEKWLGRCKLAHLYLFSIAISELTCCWWDSKKKDETESYSTGASGAICGVVALYFLEAWRRGYSFVLLGGLLQLNPLSALFTIVLSDTVLFAYEKSKTAVEKQPKTKTDVTAHLGGFLGGLLFYLLCLPWRPASSLQPLPVSTDFF